MTSGDPPHLWCLSLLRERMRRQSALTSAEGCTSTVSWSTNSDALCKKATAVSTSSGGWGPSVSALSSSVSYLPPAFIHLNNNGHYCWHCLTLQPISLESLNSSFPSVAYMLQSAGYRQATKDGLVVRSGWSYSQQKHNTTTYGRCTSLSKTQRSYVRKHLPSCADSKMQLNQCGEVEVLF